jgi:nucleotide-binding universal stress UspA family protein
MATPQVDAPAVAEHVAGPASVSISHILVATDFSRCSDAALEFAAALARQQRAKVSLFHCLQMEAGFPKPMQASLPELDGDRNTAATRMYEALSRAEFAHIETDAIIGRGELWPVLKATMRKYEIDMVVVGTHGRDGFRKLLLGSAAEQVFRHSVRPVMTVGPHADSSCLEDGGFRRVLYATDLSASSLHGLPYAVTLARQNLILLHVLCSGLASGEYGATTFEDVDFFTKREQLRRLIPGGVDAEAIVDTGLPASTILRVAHEQNASLIVMGVNPSSAFAATHLPWATAHRVIFEAHCPVLTVR